MKTLNGIKTGLVCTATLIAVSGIIGFAVTGGWHLLFIAIAACVVGLTLKEEEEL